MKTKKLKFEDAQREAQNVQKLPRRCYVYIDGNPVGSRIGIVQNGQTGYTPFSQADGDKDTPTSVIKHVVLEQNEKLGVTPVQMLAMLHGSMRGFHIPGADPDHEINVRLAESFAQEASTWKADLDAQNKQSAD